MTADDAKGIRVRKKWLTTLLKYGIGLGLLAYVVWSNWEAAGPGSVGLKAALMRPNRWEYLALAGPCVAAALALTFVRWYMLVRAQDLPFSLRDAFRLGLVGYFFNTFLPGSVGGDLLKAAFIAREQQRRTVAVSTVLIDRGIGLWGLIALTALVGSVFWLTGDPMIGGQPDLMAAIRAANGFMVVTIALWLILGTLPERRAQRFAQRLHSIPRVGKVFAEFWRAVWIYRLSGLTIIKGLVMSMVGHLFNVLAFYLAARTFLSAGDSPQMPGLLQHFILVPAGLAFQGLFPSPGGMGGAEFVFGLFYSRLGFPAEGGILGCLGTRMLAWTIGLGGYIVYLFMRREIPKHLPGHAAPSATDSNSSVAGSSTTQVR